MISVWWTLFAFIGGGCAGVLLISLMRVAADAAPQSVEGRPIRSDSARSDPHSTPLADSSK
jgi:hypothetical protein